MNPALFLAAPVLALLAPTSPAADPVLQPEAQQKATDQFDFDNEEARMTVPVRIGATGPYRFVVDTGAERTVISRELAATLGLASGRTVRITAMSGLASVGTFIIPDISVGTTVGAARLGGSRIEAPALIERNLGAPGLVGIDALQGHALTIDFPRQTMTVAPATRRTRFEEFGPDDIVIRARNLLGQLVVTDATYRGQRVRVVIDTGSVVSIGNLALRKLVASTTKQMQPVKLLSVTGVVMQADYTHVTEIKIGAVGFGNLPVAFSDATPFERLGLRNRPALLLGMDALRLFDHVRIDFANREMRLASPNHAGEPLWQLRLRCPAVASRLYSGDNNRCAHVP